MADPLLQLADRLDDNDKRVERLESLEFGTVAFPSGGFIPICDAIIGPAPAASITLCPLGIPQTFRHLFVICHYMSQSTQIPFFIGWAEMNINADFGAVYFNHSRQELDTGIGPPFNLDGEVNPIGAGTDTKWSIPRPAQRNTSGNQKPTQCFILIPGYSRTGNFKTIAWWGGGSPTADDAQGGPFMDNDQGGGEFRRFAGGVRPAPITSITFSHAVGAATPTFQAGSSFSLYGML